MDTVMVFTSKPLETMIEEGGSGHWSANKKRLKKCTYLIATKSNTFSERFPSNREINQGAAFLIGKISNVIDLPMNNRLIIQLSEYAETNIPKSWTGNRNPVAYTNIDKFEAEHSLDITTLEWKKFPTSKAEIKADVRALTVNEAKEGIAKTLGVDPSCIEIIIKA